MGNRRFTEIIVVLKIIDWPTRDKQSIIGTNFVQLNKKRYETPPISAIPEPTLIEVFIEVKFRNSPVRIKARRSLHAK